MHKNHSMKRAGEAGSQPRAEGRYPRWAPQGACQGRQHVLALPRGHARELGSLRDVGRKKRMEALYGDSMRCFLCGP